MQSAWHCYEKIPTFKIQTAHSMFWQRKNNDIGSEIFFQNANDLLIIVNSKGRILRINKTCKRIFGYEPEELVGTNVMDLVHPDDMERAGSQITNLLENAGQTLTFKNKATHKDGSTRWLEWSTCVVDGIMYATGVDVTHKEEKIRNIANFRKQYISGKESNIGLWELDIETREFYGDEHVYEIFGLPFKINQRLRELSYILTPESKLFIETHLENVLKSKLFEDFDCDIIRQTDNQIRSISISGNFIFDENFNVKSFFGTIQDISEQKEIMKSFNDLTNQQRTILDTLDVEVLLFSANEIQWMNKQEFIGYTAKDIEKKTLGMLFKDKKLYEQIKDTAYAKMSHGETYTIEFEAIKKDKKTAWLHVTGKMLSDKKIIYTVTDITEQKNAEMTIRKSHTLLKDTQHTAHVGCWETLDNGKTIWFDDEACRIFDIDENTHTESVENFLNYIDENDRNNVQNLINSYTETNSFIGLNFKIKTRKNITKHLYVTGDMFKSPDGTKRLVGILQDITKLQNLESELQDKQQRINAIYKISPTAIGIVSGYNIFDCNPEFYKLSGYSTEELQDNGLQKLMSKDELERLKTAGYKANGNSSVYSFETVWNKKDGTNINVLLNFSGVNSASRHMSNIITVTDISELKHTQYVNNLLIEAINQSTSEFIIYDKNWTAIYANSQAFKNYNCSASDVIGHTIYELKTNSKQQELLYNEIIEKGFGSGEYQTHVGDTISWFSLNITPIWGKDSEVISYISVKDDITARKNMEMELMKALSKAEQSDKLKEALLQNLSHEVRTPLNSISGFSEIISGNNDLSIDTIKSYTNIIRKSSNQLLGIITDMLVMSDIQLGQTAIQKSEIDPNAILERMYKTFLSQAEGKDVKLNYLVCPNDTKINTDETKLVQIITNLITNAIKFTKEGEVSFGYKHISDKQIQFFVKDTGIGISKENQKMIFDRFFQVTMNKAENSGTGLGLPISNSFAKMLGGKLTVESDLGKGSTFYLTLPVNLPEQYVN